MPYIDIDSRKKFAPKAEVANFAGELNYQISMLCQQYIVRHGLKYQNINDVLGALEGAKLEFYRRVAAPYEAIKADYNGDIYAGIGAGQKVEDSE